MVFHSSGLDIHINISQWPRWYSGPVDYSIRDIIQAQNRTNNLWENTYSRNRTVVLDLKDINISFRRGLSNGITIVWGGLLLKGTGVLLLIGG